MYPSSNQQLNYETDEAVFWFSSAFDPLNNWSAHAITIWDETFRTVEHAFHYRKFQETVPELAAEILHSPSPWAAWQLAQQHKHQRRADWDEIKVAIMREIIAAKVAQHSDVRDCLIKTGDKTLVENSPWDVFWGCGADGMGQNQMGKVLMTARKALRSSAAG